MKIAGLHPWDYAALWGRTHETDGVLLYNASSEHQVKDRAYLGALIGAIQRQRAVVLAGPQNFEPQDESELLALEQWAKEQYTAAIAACAKINDSLYSEATTHGS